MGAEFHRGRLTVVGFGAVIAARYKRPSGTLQPLTVLIADGAGGAEPPGMAFAVTETPYGWTYAAAAMVAGRTYDLSGTVIPADATVRLSRAPGGATYAQLEAGQFATVTPDANGAWSYADLAGTNDTLYAWIRLERAVLDAYDCAVSCDMTATAQEPVGSGGVVYAAIPMDDQIDGYSLMDINSLQGYPTITVKGTCPAAATQVYVSKHPLVSCPDCTCQTCGGMGAIADGASCVTCGGTGTGTDTTTVCEACGGRGRQNCRCETCGGDGIVGASPCQTCGGGRVVQSLISEAILTDEVVGSAEPSFICAACGGTGSVSSACTACSGTGEAEGAECAACGGTGSVSSACTACSGTGTLADNTYSMTWDGEYHRNRGSVGDGSGDAIAWTGWRYGSDSDGYGIGYRQPWPEWNYLIWCIADAGLITMSLSTVHRMCLAGDTLIRMADGTDRQLDSLSPGDMVLAGDGTATEVLRVQRGRINPYHTLYRFDDSTVIDATAPHRFFNAEQGFYQWLDRWDTGEHAVTADGKRTALVSAERVDEPAECFGLWTASRDYYAGGLLSGETAANQRLLAEATAEQAVAMAASLSEKDIMELSGWEAMTP